MSIIASYYLVCCRIQYCIFRVVSVVAFLILFVFVVAVVHLCRPVMLLHFLREGKEGLNGGIAQLVKMKHEQKLLKGRVVLCLLLSMETT